MSEIEARLRETALEFIEAAVAAGQPREQAVAKVSKIIRDGIAKWRRSNFKIVEGKNDVI